MLEQTGIHFQSFRFKTDLPRVYSAITVFVFRLSRARRLVENVFGILAAKWEIFNGPINLAPIHVVDLTLACCALHNFLIKENKKRGENYIHSTMVDVETSDGTVVPGSWRKTVSSSQIRLQPTGNRAGKLAIKTREMFCEYFNTTGSVPWQNRVIFGTLNK